MVRMSDLDKEFYFDQQRKLCGGAGEKEESYLTS